MAKTKKTKQIIDGKIEEASTALVTNNISGGKKNVRSIDELLGRKVNPYSNGTIDEYETKIKDMTLADLQAHASNLGLLPVSNKNVLVTRLLGEYRKKARGYYNTIQFNTIEPKNKDAVLKALKAGAN